MLAKWDRKEGYPIEWVTTDTLELFEGAMAERLVRNEVKRKTVKKAKKDEDDVDNVDDHADKDDDEFDDDDGFDYDDHYDYAGLHPNVQNAMHINDENENENEDNEDEEASLQRMVNVDRESREMMFEVSASGNHALVRGTEYPNSLLVHIKLETISKFVDENAKEVPAEREQGKYETEVENEVVLGGENEEEGEKEMAGIENAIEMETVDENANEVENEGEGEGGGENEEEGEKEMLGIENAIEVETVDENAN
ncbi:tumor rejection antigen P815A-like [Helianthus annuus]|uniref:tumor rejection antigen P815A-like n=1 Tax=Helianthus annuus TaxID=4232 RepID=UPI000B909429|nr:tumor rejection antigen P815A-like [Helianthus annuus]